MAIDVERLLSEAVRQHGIRLDPHDPAVVLVTLNRLALEDAAKSVAADIRTATSEFEQASNRIQSRLGAAIASRLKAASPGGLAAIGSRWIWLTLGLASGVGMFSIGVAVGKWVLQ